MPKGLVSIFPLPFDIMEQLDAVGAGGNVERRRGGVAGHRNHAGGNILVRVVPGLVVDGDHQGARVLLDVGHGQGQLGLGRVGGGRLGEQEGGREEDGGNRGEDGEGRFEDWEAFHGVVLFFVFRSYQRRILCPARRTSDARRRSSHPKCANWLFCFVNSRAKPFAKREMQSRNASDTGL